MKNRILSLNISMPMVIGLSAILFWVVYFAPFPKPKPFGDNIFNTEAQIISDVIKGKRHVNEIRFNHTAIASIFYVVPALFSSSDPQSIEYLSNATIWNFLFFLMSTFFYFKSIDLLFDKKGKLIFLILYFFPPMNVYYHLGFLAEPIAYFLISLLTWHGSKMYVKNGSWHYIDVAIFSIIISFLVLSRPNGILLIPLLITIGLLWKRRFLMLVGATSLLLFVALSFFINILSKTSNEAPKDKVVFLLEQIHTGQFFLRHEPTDWSFFNNEYRADSRDYQELQVSRSKVYTEIESGKSPRLAYFNEILQQYRQNILSSILHPITKFIHGHSLHIGTTIPGKLSVDYVKAHPKIFLVNFFLKIFIWTIIVMAVLFLYRIRGRIFDYWFLWLPWISFALFDVISATEQRYIFPIRILITILAIGFLVYDSKSNSKVNI